MRVTKLPYSLVFYESGTFIAWNFNDRLTFSNHIFLDYQIKYNLRFVGFENMFSRPCNLLNKREWSVERVNDFLKELKIEV